MADEMRTATPPAKVAPPVETADYAEARGSGWLAFAGIVVGLIGVINVIYGIAAIGDSSFFVHNTKYIFGDLNTWGWIALVIGVVQIFSALGILAGHQAGRWVGIITVFANAIAMLVFLPAYPLAALSIFAIDVLVLYGLVAYGGQHRAALY